MKISSSGIQVVKHFEGLFLKSYRDPVGVWTIGYGHTGAAAKPGNVISEDEAVVLLQGDLEEYEKTVEKFVDTNLSQQQFDALVSFSFNVGGGAFAGSTLRKKLNLGDFEAAAKEFGRWNKGTVDGVKVELAGLTRRRKSERRLFESGDVVFYDSRGIVDPDSLDDLPLQKLSISSEAMLKIAGSEAEFLANNGLAEKGTDEAILKELGVAHEISAPVELLIALRNDRYADSRPRYWAVVNFDIHSAKPRMFVIDVVNHVVNSYLCAHGIGSEGANDDGMANVFSNKKKSKATSLGIYRCAETYISEKNGYALKLDGLEDTNDNARSRLIVVHGANYVSEEFAKKNKRVGRSEGCPALDHKHARTVIDQLKLGSFLIHWKTP